MIHTLYSDKYFANTPTASMQKLPLVAESAKSFGFANLHEPEDVGSLSIQQKLKKIHDPHYVDAFQIGNGRLACSNGWDWTPEIRDGVFEINKGQINAAYAALEYGIAANVAQGFHHAGINRGCGFCTFNGLALVASELSNKKVFVLDCDEHGGNGTANFTEYMDNFSQVTINGCDFGIKENKRTVNFTLPKITNRFNLYVEALNSAFGYIKGFSPDLIIYQAGADPHIDDPLGSLGMTTEQMAERDRIVFTKTKEMGIPVLFVLAGGYQKPIETKLVPLHVNTFQEAYNIYYK